MGRFSKSITRKPLSANAFKPSLLKRTIVRALLELTEGIR